MIKQNKNSYYQNAYYYELFHWFNCMKSDLYRHFLTWQLLLVF